MPKNNAASQGEFQKNVACRDASFTTILAGKNGGMGIGLVEIHNVHWADRRSDRLQKL